MTNDIQVIYAIKLETLTEAKAHLSQLLLIPYNKRTKETDELIESLQGYIENNDYEDR